MDNMSKCRCTSYVFCTSKVITFMTCVWSHHSSPHLCLLKSNPRSSQESLCSSSNILFIGVKIILSFFQSRKDPQTFKSEGYYTTECHRTSLSDSNFQGCCFFNPPSTHNLLCTRLCRSFFITGWDIYLKFRKRLDMAEEYRPL